jgi:hypothetical protein
MDVLVEQLPFHRGLSRMLALLLSAHVSYISTDKDIVSSIVFTRAMICRTMLKPPLSRSVALIIPRHFFTFFAAQGPRSKVSGTCGIS